MSHSLYDLFLRLEGAKIPFRLSRNRSNSLLVTLTLVGERVEIDVFEDGHMEVSRFMRSKDVVRGSGVVDRLIAGSRG